jgi:hypothetical protein
MNIKDHFEYLGLEVQDKVTGFTGVVTTLSFDLYGCIQTVVTPKALEDGSIPEGRWFDIARLKVISDTPVMESPDYDLGYVTTGKKGCALKSLPR